MTAADAPELDPLVGTVVEGIRITEKLGEGGMGAVYGGFDETLQRRVALKTIRSSLHGPVARVRFLREARILSQLQHPGICSIHGFIATDRHEFLVLERVEGRSLREAIKAGLSAAERLRISIQLAAALATAHARGVVHRDLKPDNVMITPAGEVKVLDFGLAQIRAASSEDEATAPYPALGRPTGVVSPPAAETASDGSGHDSVTQLGSVVGTAAYMSPEQARGEPVVAASDIYSLGLLFQHLWTGHSPYRSGLTKPALLLAAAQGDTLAMTGVDRDVARLVAAMKAAAQEDRPGAAQVLERLRRIETRPARRLRAAAAAVAVVLAVLATVKYTVDLRRERNLAEQRSREAEEVVQFMVDLFQLSEPGQAQGNTVTARELLDKGAARIRDGLAEQPLVRARLDDTIGTVYSLLGLYEPAAELLTEALEIRRARLAADHPELADSLAALGVCRMNQGQLNEAETLVGDALHACEARFGEHHAMTARIVSNLGLVYWKQGRYAEAEAAHRRALAIRIPLLGADDETVAGSHNNLGEVLREQGRLEEAEEQLRRAMEIKEKRLGADHPDLASTANNLGQLAWELKRYDEAEAMFRRAYEINRRVLGPDSEDVASNLVNLATVHDDQGRHEQAEAEYREALAILVAALGPAHPKVGIAQNNLGDLYRTRQQPEPAADYYRQALANFEAALGPSHPLVAYPVVGLAQLAVASGRRDEAEALLERGQAIREQALPADHPLLAETRQALAELRATPTAR